MKLSDEELNEFKTEAMDLLDSAEKSLLDFDNPSSFNDHKNIIFRAFHSLKGSAGMLELTALQNHMHILENKLTMINSVEMVQQSDIDFFLKGIDGAKTLLNGGTVDLPEVVETSAPEVSVSATEDIKPKEDVNKKEESVAVRTSHSVLGESSELHQLLEQAAKLLAIKRSEDFVEIQSEQVKEQVKLLLQEFHLKMSQIKKNN